MVGKYVRVVCFLVLGSILVVAIGCSAPVNFKLSSPATQSNTQSSTQPSTGQVGTSSTSVPEVVDTSTPTPTPTPPPPVVDPNPSPAASSTPDASATPTDTATPASTPDATSTPDASPTPYATSTPTPTPSPTPSVTQEVIGEAGFMILAPSSPKAMSLSGGANVTVYSGKVIVNSTDSDALDLSGSTSGISAQLGVFVSGGVVTTGGAKVQPSPTTNSAPVADPLATLPAPTAAATATQVPAADSTGVINLQPGTYANTLSFTNGTAVKMAPGLYILKGGLNLSGGASLSGDNVTLYIAGGSVSLSGGSPIHLTAPSSGTYAGITIFQARANTSTASLSGGSNWFVQGTIYFPSASVHLSGGSNLPLPLTVIVYQLSLNGGSFILSP